MFDNLTDKLQGIIRNIQGNDKLTPENMEEAIREVRRSLIEADVSLKVVKIFISQIRQKALDTQVISGVTPGQQFIKIVNDELVNILGGENSPLNLSGKPAILMLLGLQGAGKTTACAKLALKLKGQNQKPLMVACDIKRPAAIEQLITLGQQIDVPVYSDLNSTDIQEICKMAIKKAKDENLSPVIIDTAGRLQIDTELMAQLLILDRYLEPTEKLLVVDAMTGQEAVNIAETFNTQLNVSGIILTKIDGDARGGAALSVREAVGKPIKYIGTGEKLDNLEEFYPDRMASRILGMGDIITLVEKAQANIDEKQAENIANQMLMGDFSLETFISAQNMLKKMGPMKDVMKLMGLGSMFGINTNQQELIATHGEAMIRLYQTAYNSMNKKERKDPSIINVERRIRIAKGSGLKETDIKRMLDEFSQMKTMFSQFKKMFGMMGGNSGMANMFKNGKMPTEDSIKDVVNNLSRNPGKLMPKQTKPPSPDFPFTIGSSNSYKKNKKK